MGYRKNTEIDKRQKDQFDKMISLSSTYCNLKGVYSRINIIKKDTSSIEFEKNIKFESVKLAKFLKNSSSIFIIGVTSGTEIVKFRDELSDNDLTASVIADAVGSELVESMAEWLHDFLSNLIAKEGLGVTKNRFSPGYGDFELKNQNIIYKLLRLDKLNIQLSENYILIPEKSITAIIGIE